MLIPKDLGRAFAPILGKCRCSWNNPFVFNGLPPVPTPVLQFPQSGTLSLIPKKLEPKFVDSRPPGLRANFSETPI